MNLLEKIEFLCAQKGITIYKLEQETDLTKGSIRKWETSSPSCDKLLKVANRFDVSMESLINERIEISGIKQVQLLQKLIKATVENKLMWEKGTILKASTYRDSTLYSLIDLDDYDCFSPEASIYTEDSFYASYRNGGYLLAKIGELNSIGHDYVLFIYINGKFNLYASQYKLKLVKALYDDVNRKVMGADNLVEEFLRDDFENNDEVKVKVCELCGIKTLNKDCICDTCRLKFKDKALVITADNSDENV